MTEPTPEAGRRRPPTPAISVVIPTYNRRTSLERVLSSLADQRGDEEFEVIVVSDGSTDDTDEYLRNESAPLPVRAVSQPNRGPSAARNRGVDHARGDLVLFLDDDVVADQGLVAAHLSAHRSLGERSVVIGPMLDPPGHALTPWVAWEQEMLRKQYRAMQHGHYSATARQFYTGNASVGREHVLAAGGFDTSFRRAEDIELAFRLADRGLTFHFDPTAIGLHYAERSFDAWRRTAYTYGRSDVIFARDHGRGWLFDFVRDGFRRHHPLIRLLVRRSLRSPAFCERTTERLERVVHTSAGGHARRLTRYALSGIYAVEYHRGVAEELGSSAAFDALVTRRARWSGTR